MALKMNLGWLYLVPLFIPAAVTAGNYNETVQFWFLNPNAPNWTCTDTRAACFSDHPNKYTFNGLFPIRRNGTFYAYVQGGGTQGPCKAPSGGDNFCVFTAPDTAPGWTGSGVTLRNYLPRPDDAWFWQVRSAFFEPNWNEFVLIASRTIDGGPTLDLMEAKLGRSADGITFNWTTLLSSQRSQLGIRLADYLVVPHPTQARVWVGTITWFQASGQSSVSPWKVDWNTNQVSLPDSTGVWRNIPIGGTLTFVPQAISDGRVTHLQQVTVSSGTRLEAWGTAPVSFATGSGAANNPCAPGYPVGVATNQYLINRASTQQAGSSKVQYRVFDPNSLSFTGPWIAITSQVRGLPSDYQMAVGWIASRLDSGGREYVYTGSKDSVICTQPTTWNPWAGSGLLVTRADFVP